MAKNIDINELRKDHVLMLMKIIAYNLFEWTGFEETEIDLEYLERNLIDKGLVVFAEDPENGYIALVGSGTQNFNIYNKPTSYFLKGFNYQRRFDADDCIPIRNNALSMGLTPLLEDYAERIANLWGAQDVNVEVNKTPYFVYGDPKTVTSLKSSIKSIKDNRLLMIGAKTFSDTPLQVLKTGATMILKEMQDHKNSLWGEVLTILGIDNLNIDKKERNTVDEVNANNEQISAFANAMITEREKSAERISKKYGLNIEVKRRSFGEIIDAVDDLDPEEGDEDDN